LYNVLVAIHKSMSIGCNSDVKAMVKTTNMFLQCPSVVHNA